MGKQRNKNLCESKKEGRQNATILRPLASGDRAAQGKDGTVAGFFFLALLGFAIVAFSLDAGRGATAGDSKQSAVSSEAASVGPLKKSRKTEPSESMGISLSVESQDAEVRREDSPRKSSAAASKGKKKAAVKTEKAAVKTAVRTKKKEKSAKSRGSLVVKKKAAGDPLFTEAERRIEAKDWKGAVGAYNKILKKEPRNKAALEGKVYALGQNGSDKALELLDDMAEKCSGFPSFHASRARILVRQNDTVEALAAWKRALELDPKNESYKLGLAVLTDRMGREAEALALYKDLRAPLSPETRKRRDYLSEKLD